MKDRTYRYLGGRPQYPFGYGLTYGDVQVLEAEFCPPAEGKSAAVRVTYENRGDTDTKDVIEVCVDPVESPYRTPNPRLCGFLKVDAPAGVRKTCEVRLDADTFLVVNDEGKRVGGGMSYHLFVGTSMPDERSRMLTGKEPVMLDVRQS